MTAFFLIAQSASSTKRAVFSGHTKPLLTVTVRTIACRELANRNLRNLRFRNGIRIRNGNIPRNLKGCEIEANFS
jgi:hypothetical protein